MRQEAGPRAIRAAARGAPGSRGRRTPARGRTHPRSPPHRRRQPAAAGKVGAAEPQCKLTGGDLRRVAVAEPATADERQRASVSDGVSELRPRACGADDAVDLVEQPLGLLWVAGDRLGPRARSQGVSTNLPRGAPRVVERPDRLPGRVEHLVRTARRPSVPVCAAQPGARRALAPRREQLLRPFPRRVGLGSP